MRKDKVFIVLSHMNSLKKGSQTDWEVTETVEFVSGLKKKHMSMATVIGDYMNKEIIKGKGMGVTDYEKFEEYVRQKYGPQMKVLDKQFRPEDLSPAIDAGQNIVVDASGNLSAEAITVSD